MSTLELSEKRVVTLRDALDKCTGASFDDWVTMPSAGWGRPAITMLAGIFDPGGDEPETRPLVGHSLAVYEPDPRLSLVWPVPEDDSFLDRSRRFEPEWLTQDTHDWGRAERNWAIVLLSGAPIWQEPVWYLDWGSGNGGYVADFRPDFEKSDPAEVPLIKEWTASRWSIGLASLLNGFAATGDWFRFDPTSSLVPSPSPVHPVDGARLP